jgi:DOPA 4,5-dioxygenase
VWLDRQAGEANLAGMREAVIQDFHVHLYFNADEIDQARAVGDAVRERFGVPVGHYHAGPVGPHPRGSVQLTVPTDQFGEVAQWLALNRNGLTIFAHASTGDDVADHTRHVIWFGESEKLNLALFGL